MRRLIPLGVKREKISFFKNLSMRIGVTNRLTLDEWSRSSKAVKESKIRYTRKFLLSFMKTEICNGLPIGLERSILSEFDDGTLFRSQGTADVVKLDVPSKEADGSSSENKSSTNSTTKETIRKWDGVSSWLKNKDSQSQIKHDPDSEIKNEDRHLCPLNHLRHCGIPGTGSVHRVSGCTHGLLVPMVQENGSYQLNKCENPYRPPRTCKVEYIVGEDKSVSGKGSHMTNSMNDKQDNKQERKGTASSDHWYENKRRKAAAMNVDTSIPILSLTEASDLDCIPKPLHKAPNLLQDSVACHNECANDSMGEFTEDTNMQVSDFITQVVPVCRGTLSILSKDIDIERDIFHNPLSHPTRFPHGFEEVYNFPDGKATSGGSYSGSNEEPNSANPYTMPLEISSVASGCSPAASEENNGSPVEFHSSLTGRNNTCFQGSTRSSKVPHLTLKMDLTEEMQFKEPFLSPTSESSTDSDLKSEHDGNIYADLRESFLTSLLIECGAFGVEEDQSAYDAVWDEILWMLQTEQESKFSALPLFCNIADSQNQLCLPDEDNLIAIDLTEIGASDDSEFKTDTTPISKAQDEHNGSLLDSDENVDYKNAICLPEEDDLITVDDLIAPQWLRSPSSGNSVKVYVNSDFPLDIDKLVTPDVTHCDDISTTPRLQSPTSPLDCDKNKVKTKQGKSPTLDSNLVQRKPCINFKDRKTVYGNSPPTPSSGTDEYANSWRSPSAKLKGYDNTVFYSVFSQPMSFPQQDLLHLTSYKQDLGMLCLSPQYYLQTSYHGFEALDSGFGGFGGYGNQATVDRFIQMDSRTHLYPSATAGHGQNHILLGPKI